MPYAAKISLAVVAAGVSLGALLGNAADPQPKRPPEPWWQAADTPAFTGPAEGTAQAVWPEEVGFPDSYRPNFDYDTMIASYWEPPADWHWYGEDDGDEPEDAAEETAAAFDMAEEAADQAAEVADAAVAEASSAGDSAFPRKAPLASEGLY